MRVLPLSTCIRSLRPRRPPSIVRNLMNRSVIAALRVAVILLGIAPADAGAQWLHNVTSGAPGNVPVAPGTSPTSWYTTPENAQPVAYAGTDGVILQSFSSADGGHRWLHNVTSGAPGNVPVAPGTSPTSWYTTPENVQHVAYVGTDGQIHELFFFIGGDNVWHHGVPGAGQVPVAAGTSPTDRYRVA